MFYIIIDIDNSCSAPEMMANLSIPECQIKNLVLFHFPCVSTSLMTIF